MISPADISILCKTKPESFTLQMQLDDVLGALFSDVSFEKILSEQLSFEKKESLLFLLQKNTIDTKNLSQVQMALQDIKKILAELPVITLTLAFAPKQAVIETISTWFIVHTKKFVLLDIVVDTTLIGGAIISYKGIYKDYSMKHILEEKYQQGDIMIQ